jgi:uncharacterized membrane protein
MKPFKTITLFHVLNILIFIAMITIIVLKVTPLPEQIPTHFAFDGTPDNFGNKTSLSALVVLAAIVSAVMYLLIALIPWVKKKKWVGFPEKERFLALPQAKQNQYWDLVKEFLAAFSAAMNVLWLTTLYGAVLVASGQLKKLPEWSIMPALFILLILILYYIRRMIGLPKKLIDAASQSS